MLVFVTKETEAAGPLELYCDTLRYDSLKRVIKRVLVVK
jgi:hypothetical protein